MARALFDPEELLAVERAVDWARELVGSHYALADDWFDRTSHQICSGRDLRTVEVAGPGRFAQIRRVYRVPDPSEPCIARWCPHYRICLQDHNLIGRLRPTKGVCPEALTPVVVHEYVHLVRFTRWEHPYGSSSRAAEEARVHGLTRRILRRYGGRVLRSAIDRWWA